MASPARCSELGLPAFDLGFGHIKQDWPWCPRWYWEFNDSTIDGQNPYTAIARASRYLEKGSLAGLIEPPWTKTLVDMLDLFAVLESEKTRREIEKRKREAKRKRK